MGGGAAPICGVGAFYGHLDSKQDESLMVRCKDRCCRQNFPDDVQRLSAAAEVGQFQHGRSPREAEGRDALISAHCGRPYPAAGCSPLLDPCGLGQSAKC